MLKGQEEGSEKKRKKRTKRRHKKDGKSKKRERRKSISLSASKRKLSKKRGTKTDKNQDTAHLNKTIQVWKQRWKNKGWRMKWKYTWGKGKWKPAIRKKWNADKKWRRKWMKKILKNWWDKKWRRKWMKRWIDNRWLTRWNKRRLRRKRLWQKRWRKSGAKKMGLTFNEFLLTERRLKALQRVPPSVINRRRKEKHYQKEKTIREKQEKRKRFLEEANKMWFLRRWYHLLINQEFYGPETFGIRPAVIQFKFYMLNGLQGLIAFLIVLYFHLTNDYNIPPEFTLQGLYTLVYFANAMDFYGSIFGMVTSYHLESYYGRRGNLPRKKNKGCFGCCANDKTVTIIGPGADIHKGDSLATTANQSTTTLESLARAKGGPGTKDDARGRRQSRFNDPKATSSVRASRSRRQSTATRSTHRSGSSRKSHRKRHIYEYADSGHLRWRATMAHSPSGTEDSFQSLYAASQFRRKSTAKTEVNCKCKGLGFLYCCMIRQCFRPGRSREFINRMGYCSWILLELAWFFNIFFTAYYNWLELYYKGYQNAAARCKAFPRPKHCDDFDWLYYLMLITVGVTFSLRNIFVFIIGMCFSERYLKRCQPIDPNDEMPSTCSDTDIDYSKVPRPILVPHVLSAGRYPYVLPGPCRPVDYMLRRIQKVQEKNLKAKLRADGYQRRRRRKKKRKGNKRRRILSTYEREAVKVVGEFKHVRRVHDPLQKGRRKPWRIPVAAGVTDVHQLPPELMTAKAWAWLHDDSESSDPTKPVARQHHIVKWRNIRKRKVQPIDSATLTVIHDPGSKSKIPIQQVIKPKLFNLSDRDSTDDPWSGKSESFFESVSGHSSEGDKGRKESDQYMELASQGEFLSQLKSRRNTTTNTNSEY